MVAMRVTTTPFAVMVVASLAIGAIEVGCSTSDDRDELTVVVDADGWVASGGSVDAGVMCPAGKQHQIGFLELDGSPLAPTEGFDRLVEGIWNDPFDEFADFLGVVELTCADGSGSFTVVMEGRNDGPWSVSEGIGAYTGLRASGTLEVERQPLLDPDGLPDPDGPPGGMPHSTTLNGVIETGSA